MRKTAFAFCMLLSITCLAQTATTKQQDIQQLIGSLYVKASIENMAAQGIELYKKQKPAVPQQTWSDILNSVDYSPYLNKVATVFDRNYTQPEIKHLIDLANKAEPGKVPKLKTTAKEQIYNTSNEFGKQLAALVTQQLKNKGY